MLTQRLAWNHGVNVARDDLHIEFLIIEPGDSDLQEGYTIPRAFQKEKFIPQVWNKRIKQAEKADSGMLHVIDYFSFKEKQTNLEEAIKFIESLEPSVLAEGHRIKRHEILKRNLK